MTTLIVAGLGIAGTALVARVVLSNMKHISKLKLPTSAALTSYYKGGFEPKMSRREAALILGRSSVSLVVHPVVSVSFCFAESRTALC
jgi:hypothetical protein